MNSYGLEDGAFLIDTETGDGERRKLNALELAAMSQAISLKRIADAITGDGENILTKPINCYGEGIGDAIQGQMVRGAAGISQYDR